MCQDPIFIVGYPRSGSTLLQAMLATQPGLVSLPETHFFSSLRRVRGGHWDPVISWNERSAVIDAVREATGVGLDLSPPADLREPGGVPVKELFEALVVRLLAQAGVRHWGTCRWIEKTPGHAYHLDEIAELYPRAQFIAIFRHPLAAVFSRRRSLPGEDRFSPVQLAERWGRTFDTLERAGRSLQDRYFCIRYEDLVADRGGTVSRICGFLDVPFRDRALEDYRQQADGLAYPWESWKQRVKEASIQNGNDDHIRNARLMDILRIQRVVGWRMRELGYQLSHPGLQRAFNTWRRLHG